MTIFEYNPAASGFVFNVEWKETTKISCGFLSFLLLLLLLLKSNCWAGNVIRLDGRNQRSLSRLVVSWCVNMLGEWEMTMLYSSIWATSLRQVFGEMVGRAERGLTAKGVDAGGEEKELPNKSHLRVQFMSVCVSSFSFFWSERKTERKEGFCYLIFL